MADAIILSRVPSGPTTADLQVQFIGSSINKAGGGNGVTIPANRVLDFQSLSRG